MSIRLPWPYDPVTRSAAKSSTLANSALPAGAEGAKGEGLAKVICKTCHGEGRILYVWNKPGGIGNGYSGCPDCDAGREYNRKIMDGLTAASWFSLPADHGEPLNLDWYFSFPRSTLATWFQGREIVMVEPE